MAYPGGMTDSPGPPSATDPAPPTPPPAVPARTDPRLIAAIVASALFMQNLDSTVVATALPAMARAFGADPLHMNVALTSYLLSLAVFIPASGWAADRFGARTVFWVAAAGAAVAALPVVLSPLLGMRDLPRELDQHAEPEVDLEKRA